jgi:hypothetical protein
MPNWAVGLVKVSGKPEGVKNFCRTFVFAEDIDKDDIKIGRKYFARSFIGIAWEDFQKIHDLGRATEIEFFVDFAWSAWTCLISGYPQKNKRNCLTLKCACKKHNVKVVITTEEGGWGFEEKIIADKFEVVYDCKDMPQYKCLECGNVQLLGGGDVDLNESECWECEKSNWEKIINN